MKVPTMDSMRKRAARHDRACFGDTHTITVPIANHDNNQHSFNENLRVQNLWDGIELMAAAVDYVAGPITGRHSARLR